MRTILSVTDFSPTASRAVKWAAFFAKQWKSRLHILHVVPQPTTHPLPQVQRALEQTLSQRIEERRKTMDELVSQIKAEGLTDVVGDVKVGRVVEHVIETASLADLTVLGLHGERGEESGGFIGSTAYRILSATPHPVLAVPYAARSPKIERVLVPVDLSPVSLQSIIKALEVVQEFQAHVYILHVIEILESLSEQEAEKILQEEVWRVIRAHIPEIHPYSNLTLRVVRRFDASTAILDTAQELDVDLIVMRTHGRHGILKSFLGSVTEQVLRDTSYPVYAFRY